MSKSIRDLIQVLNTEKAKLTEGELANDIPQMIDHERLVEDEAVLDSSTIKNGQSFLENKVPRSKQQNWYSYNNNIDPNVIRARTDPDSARPNLSSQTPQSLMPESANPPHDYVSLVRLSKESYLNYRNRFQPRDDNFNQAKQGMYHQGNPNLA